MVAKKLLVLSGPSGIGKTYLSKLLLTNYPSLFEHAKVYTTRPRRHNDDVTAINRVFVSLEKYTKLEKAGEFIIDELFAGYRYGYKKQDLIPVDKHLLVDISPWALRTLQPNNHTVIIGLLPKNKPQHFLNQRMILRGDIASIRRARMPFIIKDVDDLKTHEKFINQHGKLFEISDNETIPNEVYRWITGQLQL